MDKIVGYVSKIKPEKIEKSIDLFENLLKRSYNDKKNILKKYVRLPLIANNEIDNAINNIIFELQDKYNELLNEEKYYIIKSIVSWTGTTNPNQNNEGGYNTPFVIKLLISPYESEDDIKQKIEYNFINAYTSRNVSMVGEITITEIIPDDEEQFEDITDLDQLETEKMYGNIKEFIKQNNIQCKYESFEDVSERDNKCVQDTIEWYTRDSYNRLKRLTSSKEFKKIDELNGVTNNEWKEIREQYFIPGSHYVICNGGVQKHHQIKMEKKNNKKRRVLNTINLNGHMYVAMEEPKDLDYKVIYKTEFPKSKKIPEKEILNPSYDKILMSDNEKFIFNDPELIKKVYNKFLENNIICHSSRNSFGPLLNKDYDIINFKYKNNIIKLVYSETEQCTKILEDIEIDKYYSTLNNITDELFEKYKLGPIMYCNENMNKNKKYITYDNNKHYSRALYNIDFIYICNDICGFKESFENEGKGFYLIETNDYYNFPCGSGIYPDYNLIGNNYIIRAYMKPYRIVKNPFKSILSKLYEEMGSNAKNIVNTITGLLERTKIYKKYKAYFTSAIDLLNWRHNGKFKSIEKEGDFWTCIKCENLKIRNNGFLIKQQIYGMSYLLYNKMMKDLGISDNQIIRRYVDSLTIERTKIKRECCCYNCCIVRRLPLTEVRVESYNCDDGYIKYYDIPDVPEFKIGNYKDYEYKIEDTKIKNKTNKRKNREIKFEDKILEEIELDDVIKNEDDLILEINDNVIINADAKSGKTTFLKEYMEHSYDRNDYEIIVPLNTMRLNFNDALTIQTFLSQDRRKWIEKKIIWIDEIYKINSIEACRLLEYHDRFPNTRFIGSGSELQNDGLDFIDETIMSIQTLDYPSFRNIFNKIIKLKYSLDRQMIIDARYMQKNRNEIYENATLINIDELDEYITPSGYYIVRSNELREQINNICFHKLKTNNNLEVRPLKNIGTGINKLIKYEPCKVILDLDDEKYLIKSKLRDIVLEVKKNEVEVNYASTICLSQSLRLNKYSVVLYKSQINSMNNKELEVAFTRNSGFEIIVIDDNMDNL